MRTLQHDDTHLSIEALLKEESSPRRRLTETILAPAARYSAPQGRCYHRKTITSQQEAPQQGNAPGRKCPGKTALAPLLNNLVLAPTEAMKTILNVMLKIIGDQESDQV
jgi:hypothetical protein